jgi:NTE family protein
VKNNLLNDYVVPRVSLIRGRKFRGRLAEVFGERHIEELRRTYFCVTTNLTSGGAVVHESGPLSTWVGSSMAVPGVAPPIAWEGELLCDGGVVDNLPTDVMQNLERGSIIACNVSSEGGIRMPGAGIGLPDPDALLRPWAGPGRRPSLAEIIARTATLTADTTGVRLAAERADHYVRMPVQGFGMFDWRRLDELIERGYRHAMEQLAPIREALIR